MPKRSGEKRNFMQVAREIAEQAIGERWTALLSKNLRTAEIRTRWP
jgi:hypothetical protein